MSQYYRTYVEGRLIPTPIESDSLSPNISHTEASTGGINPHAASGSLISSSATSSEPETLLRAIYDRCTELASSAGERPKDAMPIDTCQEVPDGNGVRVVATTAYKQWFVGTYGGSVDEIQPPKGGSVAQAPRDGARGRARARSE